MFWILTLRQLYHLQIFSHSIGFSLLLMVSFAVQMILSLVRSPLFISAFISFALEAMLN